MIKIFWWLAVLLCRAKAEQIDPRSKKYDRMVLIRLVVTTLCLGIGFLTSMRSINLSAEVMQQRAKTNACQQEAEQLKSEKAHLSAMAEVYKDVCVQNSREKTVVDKFSDKK